MTQPTERRFVMEPRLDAEVETLNLAIDAEETARIAADALKVAKAGDTMTGALTLNADPTNNLHAATKQYVDNVTINTDNLGDIDYIQFDTTYATGSTAAGMLAWDQDNETLEFMLDDHVTLQVGQEHVLRVKNNSGSVAIPERTVVMFAGAAGDTIKVAPAVSDGSVNVNYLAGITTEEIPADGFGFVTQLGFVNQVNTNSWPVGTLLYSDPTTPGGLTSTEPDAPAWTMPVAAVTKQNASAGRILVRAIPGGSGAGGGASVNISDTAPAGGNAGDMWYDSTDGTLYVYYEDVDGSQWVQVQANSALTAGIESRVGALESQAIAFGALSPNYVINGGFDIWQRGTSAINGISNAAFHPDRWLVITDGVGNVNSSRVDVSAQGIGSQYAWKLERTTGTNRWVAIQMIEGALNLVGKTVTVSFYVRKGSALTSGISIDLSTRASKFGTGYDYTAKTIANASLSSSTFTKVSMSLPITTATSAAGADLFELEISANQAGATNAYFEITGVQLEVGSTATTFRRNANSLQGELAACQRYYQRWTSIGAYTPITGSGFATSTTGARVHIYPLVSFRANPTSVEVSNIGLYNVSGVQTYSSVTLVTPTPNTIAIDGTTSGVSTNQYVMLYSNGSGAGYIGISAEL